VTRDDEETSLDLEIASTIAGERALDFERAALAVFSYQFERNLPYRVYCERRGRTPATVDRWHDIPAVATAAFKIVDLACAPPERVFQTSGTTRGPKGKGRHLVPRLGIYRTAALRHFTACVAVDGRRAPVLALTPPPSLRPDSSLVQMIEWIREEYGTAESAYFVGAAGLDADTLGARLTAMERDGPPAYLIGLTAAFEQLFAHCDVRQRRFRLPYGTLVIDTGGVKGAADGSRHPLSAAGFIAACWRSLGVPGYHCINEYGMTELCSQFYDNVLRERVAGRLTPRCKVGPPWTRTLVVDPETLREVPPGTTGLLRHYDLANCGSVLAVQTEDLGVQVQDGFIVRGRLRGAEPRGCALLLEDIIEANAEAHSSVRSSPSRRV
jgi:hypothetical protein